MQSASLFHVPELFTWLKKLILVCFLFSQLIEMGVAFWAAAPGGMGIRRDFGRTAWKGASLAAKKIRIWVIQSALPG